MSLLQTRWIAEGVILAYTGADPEDGQTFLWGNAKDFDLSKGDVVKVLEISRRDGSPWARVIVAVLKGKCCGRVGQVSVNMESRLQRAWQRLTTTGSMEPVRATGKHCKAPPPAQSGIRVPDHKTTPAPAVKAVFESRLSIAPKAGNG